MIFYENTLREFINECKNDTIAKILKEKINQSGFNFGSKSEFESWKHSLPYVAKSLDDKDISGDLNVALEYKLDQGENRIDFLIYGLNELKKESLVIVELKQWSYVKDSNKRYYVYTNGGGGTKDYSHPSYQSYRYLSILKGFNTYINENNVELNSCSYLHNLDNVYDDVILNIKKYPFVKDSPCFLQNDGDKLRDFVKKYVKYGSRKTLYKIDNSEIKPTKDFAELMANCIKGNEMFTLDDKQANSVATIVSETNDALSLKQRATIIIKGGPGCGKSVVAINAMGQLINQENPKNVCYCTTNFTPKTLFKELLRGKDFKKASIDNLFKNIASFSKASEFDYDCIILDEAHRAFTWKFGQGVKKDVDLIDKIFYASRVNVFFIDEDQMVTKDDYLTIEKIKEYAKKYHSTIIENEDLCLTTQFRCLGGDNYISFINTFLGYDNKVSKLPKLKKYEFKIFDSPSEMWNEIHKKQEKYPYSRVLSGYTHNWDSKDDPDKYDFIMDNGLFKMRWNKKVTWSYINDPEQYDRIGCVHTIQGVDMEYAGVIIGKDLTYENGKICFHKEANAETDVTSGIRNAPDDLAEKMIRNTYKVLLTRAIYGTYVYCEDTKLSEYLKNIIK